MRKGQSGWGDLYMNYQLVFKRYAPFATFGLGFEGDVRTGPSSDIGASARTFGVVNFTADAVGPVMLGYSSGSRWQSDASLSFSQVSTKLTMSTRSAGILSFTAYTAGANPCIPLAPDIDTFVDINIVFSANCIVFDGTVRGDDFPNAEVWVFDASADAGKSNSNAALLFDFRTTGGQNTGPLFSLFGSGSGNILGNFHKTIPIDGAGLLLHS